MNRHPIRVTIAALALAVGVASPAAAAPARPIRPAAYVTRFDRPYLLNTGLASYVVAHVTGAGYGETVVRLRQYGPTGIRTVDTDVLSGGETLALVARVYPGRCAFVTTDSGLELGNDAVLAGCA